MGGVNCKAQSASSTANSFYELEAKTIDGIDFSFASLQGKTVLITNVASS